MHTLSSFADCLSLPHSDEEVLHTFTRVAHRIAGAVGDVGAGLGAFIGATANTPRSITI